MEDRFSRDLMRGSLELMVLSVLAEGTQYGYMIQKRIRQASDNQARLQAGTLYPLLHRLESQKVIRSRWDNAGAGGGGRDRKWYELTAVGRRRLHAQANQWHAYVECVRQLLLPAQTTAPKPA